jgi:hypothetical protein
MRKRYKVTSHLLPHCGIRRAVVASDPPSLCYGAASKWQVSGGWGHETDASQCYIEESRISDNKFPPWVLHFLFANG